RCARETWDFLVDTAARCRGAGVVALPPSSGGGGELAVGKTSAYQLCTRCVMDTTDSRIRFGPDGVCDHCRTFDRDILPHWHTDERGRKDLEKLVAGIKKSGEGRDFDCIIGVSGGIDSSYLTYVAKAELGLRPLVFHVDAGWNSQESVNNIEKLVD